MTLATLAVLSLIGGADEAAAQGNGAGKIGYINSREILRQTPGYPAAESTFSRELEGFRAEVVKLQSTLDSAATAFEQNSVMLSPTQRDARRKELEAKQTELEQRTQALQQQAATRERELLEPIQQRINTVIDGIRAEGNYAVIFDLAAPGATIVSIDKSLDLTARVVERLKSGAGGS
ncbi:MAG: OmpH family outer membrane protein [Gemmatimonadota bacterium]|nr:OmpH family outer membrane protein [Gemmatimonadota bacterium]